MTGFQKQEMTLVTGGAGFIGSHLVEALLHRGQKVRVLDNLSTGKVENLEEATGFRVPSLEGRPEKILLIPLGEKAEFLRGDISDEETCRKACQGVSCVFHEAALGSVQRSVDDPLTTHRVNATGTLNMLWAAKEAGVKRFIYASSSSVFGNIFSNPEEVIPKEETHPTHPESPYAATKLMGELYCRIFSRIYGLETVSLRYFNVFGPRQDPESMYAAVIPRFITSVLSGKPPTVYGDGLQTRDFTYIDNVVEANLRACSAPGTACGKVFNIACGERVSLLDILEIVYGLAGRRVAPKFEPSRPGDVRDSLADISLAKDLLGYATKVAFSVGLSRTFEHFRGADR
jgi:nucleoside-diphosphate-sugar epimerase